MHLSRLYLRHLTFIISMPPTFYYLGSYMHVESHGESYYGRPKPSYSFWKTLVLSIKTIVSCTTVKCLYILSMLHLIICNHPTYYEPDYRRFENFHSHFIIFHVVYFSSLGWLFYILLSKCNTLENISCV